MLEEHSNSKYTNISIDLTFNDSKYYKIKRHKCQADCVDCNGECGDLGRSTLYDSAEYDCYDCACACPC